MADEPLFPQAATATATATIKQPRKSPPKEATPEVFKQVSVTFRMLRRFWDWVDDRDIDKHAVSLAILYGTMTILKWAMAFADTHPDKSGVEIAAIIAAVSAPYMALQTAALSFYFKSRTST